MKLWMKSSCTTCRKAKALLAELGLTAEIRDYFKQPLTVEELNQLVPSDPRPLLGNKSPKFRELGLKDQQLSRDEAIDLMLADNNLLKRPLLVHAKGIIIGFDEAAYRALKG